MAIVELVSQLSIPVLFFSVIVWGLYRKIPVYDAFTDGAKEGLKTALQITPTLVGLMIGVRVLRASGFLDVLAVSLSRPMEVIGIPAQVVPVIFVRLFSASAATGLVLELFEQYGTDSYIGLLSSILMSCTETCFYTMSVYFLSVKVTKTRWTLVGALLSTAAGIAASVLLAGWMCVH